MYRFRVGWSTRVSGVRGPCYEAGFAVTVLMSRRGMAVGQTVLVVLSGCTHGRIAMAGWLHGLVF